MSDHSNTFHLTIASVGETRFDGAAVSITVPGTAGEFTILPHHEPIVTTLKSGHVIVHETMGEPKRFLIEQGVVECSDNRVVVLL
ncbi:MAG TPA: F0F1 ATP synthase subunit epsilon [Candidatus Paceibacterota bacterium]|nr:F0F1 ATP synthase subunit epsilon [Candidatus Paceibacterota bacterium]